MKNIVSKFFKVSLSTFIAFVLVYYCAYYILVSDNPFQTSISSIIENSHHLTVKQHLVVLAFLPIYIATVIFGAGMLGFYLGIGFQYLFHRTNMLFKDK